jgi:hypothetical protein
MLGPSLLVAVSNQTEVRRGPPRRLARPLVPRFTFKLGVLIGTTAVQRMNEDIVRNSRSREPRTIVIASASAGRSRSFCRLSRGLAMLIPGAETQLSQNHDLPKTEIANLQENPRPTVALLQIRLLHQALLSAPSAKFFTDGRTTKWIELPATAEANLHGRRSTNSSC